MSAHPSATADVLVVGGGPAGAATAIRLAAEGHRVVVVERGDRAALGSLSTLLTPRSLTALAMLGLGPDDVAHRIDQLRLSTRSASTATPWPSHARHPDHGVVELRRRFDERLLAAATAAGATVLDRHEALAPLVERGFVRGARVVDADGTAFEVRATYTVLADGANSRFGRALGTYRQPSWPYAVAHHATFRSPLHAAAEVELVVDLADRSGTPIAGFGWMFPTGASLVDVGVLMMSTSASFQVVNPAHLLDAFVADRAAGWQLDDAPVDAPTGGRIPLGLSVGPLAGPTYLLVGDAVGAANPMSGAGIEAALETGTIAAEVLAEALASGSAAALQRYPRRLDEWNGGYYQVGRLTTHLFGRPAVWRRVTSAATRRPGVAGDLVRIIANELRSGRGGRAELVVRAGRALGPFAPDA